MWLLLCCAGVNVPAPVSHSAAPLATQTFSDGAAAAVGRQVEPEGGMVKLVLKPDGAEAERQLGAGWKADDMHLLCGADLTMVHTRCSCSAA